MIERLKIDFAIPPHRVVLRATHEFEAALNPRGGANLPFRVESNCEEH